MTALTDASSGETTGGIEETRPTLFVLDINEQIYHAEHKTERTPVYHTRALRGCSLRYTLCVREILRIILNH